MRNRTRGSLEHSERRPNGDVAVQQARFGDGSHGGPLFKRAAPSQRRDDLHVPSSIRIPHQLNGRRHALANAPARIRGTAPERRFRLEVAFQDQTA